MCNSRCHGCKACADVTARPLKKGMRATRNAAGTRCKLVGVYEHACVPCALSAGCAGGTARHVVGAAWLAHTMLHVLVELGSGIPVGVTLEVG